MTNLIMIVRTYTEGFYLHLPSLFFSDEHGDRPRPLPVVKELKSATDVFERKSSPAWAYTVFLLPSK